MIMDYKEFHQQCYEELRDKRDGEEPSFEELEKYMRDVMSDYVSIFEPLD